MAFVNFIHFVKTQTMVNSKVVYDLIEALFMERIEDIKDHMNKNLIGLFILVIIYVMFMMCLLTRITRGWSDEIIKSLVVIVISIALCGLLANNKNILV